jgi:DNA ligase (NAD+)
MYESLVLLGINNIGETTVDILSKYILEKNNLEINVNNWMKEFTSDKNINIINKMENFGEISANNIINETKKIKNIDLSQFIASLCIPNVGIKIGKELSKKGNDLNDILNFSIDELSSINGVGTIMAERLNNFFIKNKEYIVCMSKNFIINNNNAVSSMKKICFTGAMRYNRSQMSEIAIKNNFNVIDTVTKDLNILVVSDNSDFSSSKCKKAEKYGVEIITESEFLKDYN